MPITKPRIMNPGGLNAIMEQLRYPGEDAPVTRRIVFWAKMARHAKCDGTRFVALGQVERLLGGKVT